MANEVVGVYIPQSALTGSYKVVRRPGLLPYYVSDKYSIWNDNGVTWRISPSIGNPSSYAYAPAIGTNNILDVKGPWVVASSSTNITRNDVVIKPIEPKPMKEYPEGIILKRLPETLQQLTMGYKRQAELFNDRPWYLGDDNYVICFTGTQWILTKNLQTSTLFAFNDSFFAAHPMEINNSKWVDMLDKGAIFTLEMTSKSTTPPTFPEKPNLFRDPSFGPGITDLSDLGALGREVQWIRAQDIVKFNYYRDMNLLLEDRERIRPHLFNTIEVQDILQGGLGTCWLLSATAALAEFPELIEKLFLENNIDQGRHRMKIYNVETKMWDMVEIDDFIPCFPVKWYHDKITPLFAQPNGNELWVILLEKCFAKYVGSYKDLEGGYTERAWMALTGVLEYDRYLRDKKTKQWKICTIDIPFAQSSPKEFGEMKLKTHNKFINSDDLFNVLLENDEKNFIQSTSITPHIAPVQGKEIIRKDGLVEGHGFTLIRCYKDAETNIRLLQIRNPWGGGIEWLGDWSDSSSQWKKYPNITKVLGYSGCIADGTFWMNFEDFSTTFDDIQVCRLPSTTMPPPNKAVLPTTVADARTVIMRGDTIQQYQQQNTTPVVLRDDLTRASVEKADRQGGKRPVQPGVIPNMSKDRAQRVAEYYQSKKSFMDTICSCLQATITTEDFKELQGELENFKSIAKQQRNTRIKKSNTL